jgi:pantoate--beta-alanine ligase
MDVVQDREPLKAVVKKARQAGRSIGLVPTMGFLHAGHLSLIRKARTENDLVVVSVFVNPTQFGPHEDLSTYPRDHERDLRLIASEKADIAFFPAVEDIYPPGYTTYVTVEGFMSQTLCGRSRPSHFRGVTTVVAKLFHLVSPARAYFGQKDAQQVAVISQMVRDLDFDLQVVACPTVRESDGLAMSSRNSYLSSQQRAQAPGIYAALCEAQSSIAAGERNSATLVRQITHRLAALSDAQIDYIAVVDAHGLFDVEQVAGTVLIAVAIKLGRTRLIDNIRIEA